MKITYFVIAAVLLILSCDLPEDTLWTEKEKEILRLIPIVKKREFWNGFEVGVACGSTWILKLESEGILNRATADLDLVIEKCKQDFKQWKYEYLKRKYR
jgi:hypothetical protein